MTHRTYKARIATWMTSFYEAMFEDRIKYLGNGQFIGFSLLKNVYPRQLHLDL